MEILTFAIRNCAEYRFSIVDPDTCVGTSDLKLNWRIEEVAHNSAAPVRITALLRAFSLAQLESNFQQSCPLCTKCDRHFGSIGNESVTPATPE